MPITRDQLSGAEKVGTLYSRRGEVYRLRSFCLSPTVEMESLETGRVEDFGINGLTARDFDPLTSPHTELVELLAKIRPSYFQRGEAQARRGAIVLSLKDVQSKVRVLRDNDVIANGVEYTVLDDMEKILDDVLGLITQEEK